MSATTHIQWTDKTWNPVRGCSVVSPGCVNCYAMKQAHRFSGEGKAYHGLTKQTKAGPQWTGVVHTVEAALLEPLSWRKPCRVFVNSMSDLFHENVDPAFISEVFGVMAMAKRHTFQVLTKRAARMREVLSDPAFLYAIENSTAIRTMENEDDGCWEGWPLRNVWLGVSVEDQKHADERIPLLLQTTAAVRFISAEPLLGPVTLRDWPKIFRNDHVVDSTGAVYQSLDWVIVGGESGSGARPFDIEWARTLVEQCRTAGVACFVKQVGSRPDGWWTNELGPRFNRHALTDRKGGDPAEWPADLRVREFPPVFRGEVGPTQTGKLDL